VGIYRLFENGVFPETEGAPRARPSFFGAYKMVVNRDTRLVAMRLAELWNDVVLGVRDRQIGLLMNHCLIRPCEVSRPTKTGGRSAFRQSKIGFKSGRDSYLEPTVSARNAPQNRFLRLVVMLDGRYSCMHTRRYSTVRAWYLGYVRARRVWHWLRHRRR